MHIKMEVEKIKELLGDRELEQMKKRYGCTESRNSPLLTKQRKPEQTLDPEPLESTNEAFIYEFSTICH